MQDRSNLVGIICLSLLSSPLLHSSPKITPSFKNDVLPVFMSAGCNAGDCHGAARGKDGFMLSLFGYDPEGDYYRLTEEQFGRRINVAAPERSLLLEKAIDNVPHSGKMCFDEDSEAYQIIYDWIAAGAPRDEEATPEVTGIRMEPEVIELGDPSQTAQTKVIASYSDGSTRDVTRWCLYMSSNDGVVQISEKGGKVQAARAGGAHVFARFARFTQGSEVFVLPGDDAEFSWNPPKANNYIDELVYAKLQKLRIHPSELSSDEDFLRRVTIDLVGELPTVEEYHAFTTSTEPDKRAKKIDELIAREDFAELWTAKWGEWLRLNTDTNVGGGFAPKAGWVYFHWLRDQFIEDRSVGEIFHELLTSSGSNMRNPPSNFFNMLTQGPKPAHVVGMDVAQVTLGIRTGCAECHNHPFDRWTMDDYYGWTSFFTGLKRKRGREVAENLFSYDIEAPLAKHLLDDREMPHQFLGQVAPDVTGKDPRRVLADWLTDADNRLFRRHMADRVWLHFFGRGIVEPVDDVRISNPPSNEPLLEELGRRFAVDHQYSIRNLARDICNSSTYQLSAATNESNQRDNEFFSHAQLRRPRADVLFDCINIAMGHTPRIRRSDKTKAIDLFQGGKGDNYNEYFYSTFGQAPRGSVNVSETSYDTQLSQALHMINGGTIDYALSRNQSIVPELQRQYPDDKAAIIEQLYIRGLCRKPTEEELTAILADFPNTGHTGIIKNYLHGVLWGILNSSEFMFNH